MTKAKVEKKKATKVSIDLPFRHKSDSHGDNKGNLETIKAGLLGCVMLVVNSMICLYQRELCDVVVVTW